MPNYISINSKFKPFSYQELLQPVLMATQAQQQYEDQLAAVEAASGNIGNKINAQQDKDLYNQYQNYMADLKTKSDILASEGLTPVSRKDLSTLRARYASEIAPMEEAYKKRAEDIKMQQEAQLRDSSIIFDKRASMASLQDYMGGKSFEYKPLSVNEVYASAARDFAEAAKKNVRDTGIKSANAQYFKATKQIGYTPAEIQATINGDPRAPKELQTLYKNTVNSYLGRGNWDIAGKAAIMDAINRGASYGIGSQDSQFLQNRGYDIAAQAATKASAKGDTGHLSFSTVPTLAIADKTGQPDYMAQLKIVDAQKNKKGALALEGTNSNQVLVQNHITGKTSLKDKRLVNPSNEQIVGSNTMISKTNDEYQKLAATYGTNDPTLLRNKIEEASKKTAYTQSKYVMRGIDSKGIKDVSIPLLSSGNYLFELDKKGEATKKPADIEEALKLMKSDNTTASIVMDNTTFTPQLVLNDAKGKTTTYAIDPYLLDNTGTLQSSLNILKRRTNNNLDHSSNAELKANYDRIINGVFNSFISLNKQEKGTF